MKSLQIAFHFRLIFSQSTLRTNFQQKEVFKLFAMALMNINRFQ